MFNIEAGSSHTKKFKNQYLNIEKNMRIIEYFQQKLT